MSLPSDIPLKTLQFYVTTPYRCGYLPNKLAQSLIATPHELVNADAYNLLIQKGFRRSGSFAYRPHCENCKACVPVRVILNQFHASRSQKRAYQQHQFLSTTILPVAFDEAHCALYTAYQKARHAEGTLDDSAEKESEKDETEQYRNFLCQSNVNSVMVEFKLGDQLKMVSVIDIVQDGISAVYTFYSANEAKTSYGTYNVMWQIEWAKSLNLPYLYLGYWIKDSQKMAYKQHFQPQEMLINQTWQTAK